MVIMTNMDRDRRPRHHRVSTAEAKATLSALIGEVAFGHDRVVIERRGRPVAVLVSVDDAAELDRGSAPSTRRRGALALVGAWADIDDHLVDQIVADVYEARDRDEPRAVDLET